MDENAFMHALGSINPVPCVFGKVILSRHCACSRVNKRYAAEREMVSCGDLAARSACAELLDLLHKNSLFALKLTHLELPLPHGPEMRVQLGGLSGVQHEMDGTAEVRDIAALVSRARQQFDGLENLPYSTIVQSVVNCEPRKRNPLPE